MSSTSFPSSAVGLPQSLAYKLPPSLPDSARAYNVSVSPNGITQVIGQPIPVLYTLNAPLPPTAFNSQQINFEIPCGQGAGVFLDPRETMLSFRLTWTPTTTGATSGGSDCCLIGSGASFFDSLQLYSNNVPIETIGNYNLLHNMLLNSTVNSAERAGGCAVGVGCDNNSNSGINLAPGAGTYYYNFCLPLISVIGLNCLDKLIPVGSIQNLVLQMQTANMLPVTTYCNGVSTAGAVAAPILDSFSLNMKYVDIGEGASALMQQTLQDGKWFSKASTYTNSSITIPNGSNGTSSLVYQIRNSSLKSLFITNGITPSAICVNGYYDAVNIGLTSLQCSIGGSKFPNRPFNPSARPAECFSGGLMAAWGASSLKSYGGTMTRGSYGASLARPANSDDMMVVPAAGMRAFSFSEPSAPASYDTNQQNRVAQNPHMHYIGFDLERCQGALFSGVNTRSSPPYVDVTFGVATSSTVQSQAWGMSDCVLVVDTNTKSIQSFI